MTVYPFLENGLIPLEKIIFSDEAHFRLDGYVNKQNFRFWGTKNPYIDISKWLHPIKDIAWAAVSFNKIYITTFTENVTGESYKSLLQQKFYPWLNRNGYDSSFWFMQDGATPHRTREVFETLLRRFESKVIGLGYPRFHGSGLKWPPYSLDLNPCDFFYGAT